MLCVIHTSKTANVSIELVSVLLAFKCELTWTSQKNIFEIIQDHGMLSMVKDIGNLGWPVCQSKLLRSVHKDAINHILS